MLKDALVIAGKDLRLLYRDRTAVIMGYLVPIFLLVIFGVIYSGMMREEQDMKVSLLYADKERSDQSRRFLDSLKSLDVFQISTSNPEEPGVILTAEDTRDLILNGKANLGLVYERTQGMTGFQTIGIPVLRLYYDPGATIEKEMTAGLVNQAAVLSMGSDLPTEGVGALLEATGIQSTVIGEQLMTQMETWVKSEQMSGGGGGGGGPSKAMMGNLVDLTEEEVIREEVKRGNPFMANTVAGLIVMFLLFSVSFAAASLLKEQQEGTIRRLLLAPISVDSIILGKTLAIGFNSMCQAFLMLLASMIIFRVNIFGNFIPVLIMTIATVAATTTFGMVIAATARSYEQMQSSITMIVLTMSAVGGSMFPRILMPDWMTSVGLLTLNGWAIDGFLDALYYYNPPGSILGYGEAHDFIGFIHNSEALVLLLLAVIFSVVAGRVFRRRLVGAG